MPKLLILIILAFGISLSGCGGGGGGYGGEDSNPPPVNTAPSANAGADQSADEGATVNLSATGADSDGTIVSYSWQQESGTTVTITNADMANASFVAPMVAASEDLIFQVTVTDDDGATGSDTVTVTVNDVSPPPPPPPPPVGNFILLGATSATDVSADGSVVVGGNFRWTAATGPVALGGLPGSIAAEGVSADGATVVGWFQAEPRGRIEAVHWNTATGAVGLGDLIGDEFQSEAYAVSADGSVVVGTATAAGALPGLGTRHLEAFRWTSAGGMVGLGGLSGNLSWTGAQGVSDDGTVVVGFLNGNLPIEAMRWTAATGMVGLGDLSGGDFDSRAYGVSADGNVVVGHGNSASGTEAVLWTSGGGMMGLGDLPGGNFESRAYGVSADGSTVVGQSESASGDTAFVWTQANGMQSLRDLLIANGTTGLDNWELRNAKSISADGEWVVGDSINPSGDPEAFLANISTP